MFRHLPSVFDLSVTQVRLVAVLISTYGRYSSWKEIVGDLPLHCHLEYWRKIYWVVSVPLKAR